MSDQETFEHRGQVTNHKSLIYFKTKFRRRCLLSSFDFWDSHSVTNHDSTIQRFNITITDLDAHQHLSVSLLTCENKATSTHSDSAQCGHNSGQTNCDKCFIDAFPDLTRPHGL